MADSMALTVPPGPDVLAALRAVAPSEGLARAAACTWAAAQSLGWTSARVLRKKATWYHHLRLLHQAGLPVPLQSYGEKRPAAATNCNTPTLADLYALVGCRFTVTDAWKPEFYPNGTTGTVLHLQFERGGWSFFVGFDGIPGGDDEVPIGRFLRCCAVAEGGPDAA